MTFEVTLVPGANADLGHYPARDQRVLTDTIARFLESDADVETRRRKRLRPNPLAPWELRVGEFRVFYEIQERHVRVLAIGHKSHNVLYVRGRRFEM
jgi:mRNA-degrading endonuclease RelE of RelBE toxin-antitoxin system